eukprot:jgi/Bigna1/88559/estExt_fgenesh1_pg.C_340005
MRELLGLLWLIYGISLPATNGYRGTSSCPCINPWPTAIGITRRYNATANECVLAQDGECYPISFGAQGCKPYDNGTAAACLPNTNPLPEWCRVPWCYVNKTTCDRFPTKSMSFPTATHIVNGSYQALYYSYETCGYSNKFGLGLHERSLRALPRLRVSFPADSGSGYTLVTSKDDGNKEGSMVTFMLHNVFPKYGITYDIIQVSNRSNEFSPTSSYTACCHEVALNSTDICIGNFWTTDERRKFVDFTAGVYSDKFKLIVKQSSDNELSDPSTWVNSMAAPWKPFTFWVWFSTVLVLVYGGIVIWVAEGWTNESDFPGHTNIVNLSTTIFYALMSFFGSGDFRWNPHTTAGRIQLGGIGVFSLVMLTTYTAQVTVHILTSRVSGEVNSLEEAIEKNYRVCLLEASLPSVGSRYPDIQAVTATDAKEALNGMSDGRCEAALLTVDEFNSALTGRYTPENKQKHCDKTMVGDIVLVLINSMPIRDDLQPAFSWAIAKELADGDYINAETYAKQTYLGASQCEASADTSSDSLGMDVMIGPIILLASMSTFALICYFLKERGQAILKQCPRCCRCKKDKDESGDKELELSENVRDRVPSSWAALVGSQLRNTVKVTPLNDPEKDDNGKGGTMSGGFAQQYLRVPSLWERIVGFEEGDPRADEKDSETVVDSETWDIMALMLQGRRNTVTQTHNVARGDIGLTLQDVPMLLKLITNAVKEGKTDVESLKMAAPQKNEDDQKKT